MGQALTVATTAAIRQITRDGKVTLPAALRHRWSAESVLIIDRGDHAIIRPVPDDPVAAVRGAHAGRGPSSEEIRAEEHEVDDERDGSL